MRLKRVFKITSITVLVISVFFTALNYLGIFLDEEPIDYSGLIPLVELDPSENGFDVLKKGLENSAVFDERLIDNIFLKKNWDETKVSLLLEKHNDKFQLLESALTKPGFKSNPIHFEENLPDYSSYINIVKLLLIQSEYLIKQSRTTESIESIALALRFSQRIKTDQSAILISYAIGNRVEYFVLHKLHEIVSTYKLTSTEFAKVATLFDSVLPYSQDRFEMIFSGELAYTDTFPEEVIQPSFLQRVEQKLDSFQISFVHPVIDMLSVPSYYFFFQKNRTKNREYLYFVHLQSQVKDSLCNEVHFQTEFTKPHFLESLGMNAIGNINSANFIDDFVNRRCFSYFYASAIEASVAIKRYIQLHQSPPERLEMLIPSFLNEVPLDPFTGKPILYNFDAQTLYSMGLNSNVGHGRQHNFVHRCYADDICSSDPTVAIQYRH